MIRFLNSEEIAKSNIRHKEAMLEGFSRILDSGNYIDAEFVQRFEKAFAAYCKNYFCVSLNSGTDALILSLKSAGLKAGDEVILPSESFIATAFAALNLGLKLNFVDIDLNTYNIDYNRIADKITERTKAIIPVHWAGCPLDQKKLEAIAKKTGLVIIEDAAQAAGAFNAGGPVGCSKNYCAFSFFPTKNLSCMGDGGAVVVSSPEAAQDLRLLRNFGRTAREKFVLVGQNSRLDELQAMILLEKLKGLDEENNKRRKLSEVYDKYLDKSIIRPDRKIFPGHAYHFYIILLAEKRDKIQEELLERGIETTTHYKIPMHEHLVNIGFSEFQDLELTNTKEYSRRCLSLPMYSSLREEDARFIAENVNKLI